MPVWAAGDFGVNLISFNPVSAHTEEEYSGNLGKMEKPERAISERLLHAMVGPEGFEPRTKGL